MCYFAIFLSNTSHNANMVLMIIPLVYVIITINNNCASMLLIIIITDLHSTSAVRVGSIMPTSANGKCKLSTVIAYFWTVSENCMVFIYIFIDAFTVVIPVH